MLGHEIVWIYEGAKEIMEEKPARYNRDRALAIEAEIDELSGVYFDESRQEADEARSEVASVINRQQLNHDLLGVVTMMVAIYEKYAPKPEQLALPSAVHDDEDDEFFYPPY